MEAADDWRPLEKPQVRTPQTPVTPESDPEPVAEVIDLGERRDPTPETPATPEDHQEEEAKDDLLKKIIKVFQTEFQPPDIYRQDQPSLRKVIEYGWRGPWGPDVGPWRTAGKVYQVILGIPGVALCYGIAWLFARGSRLTAALILAVSLWALLR